MNKFISLLLLVFIYGFATSKVESTTELKDYGPPTVCPEPIKSNKQLILPKEVESFIDRWSETAQQEYKKYGVLPSITLAQGMLESSIGQSKLVRTNNNYFGIKCFSKTCKKGHCTNASDDHHKDFFKKYETAWLSFRDHSRFLQRKRYIHLQKYKCYKKWAEGLQKAKYATDPLYSKKLISLIEQYNLNEYDSI